MSVIRHQLKERLNRARISRYERQVAGQTLQIRRAVDHVDRAAHAGARDYI